MNGCELLKCSDWNSKGCIRDDVCKHRINADDQDRVSQLHYRLRRTERALWMAVDNCFRDHMQPEGLTPTEVVCNLLEEADQVMKQESANAEAHASATEGRR